MDTTTPSQSGPGTNYNFFFVNALDPTLLYYSHKAENYTMKVSDINTIYSCVRQQNYPSIFVQK